MLTLLAVQMLSDAVEMYAKPALFYESFTGVPIQFQDDAFSTTTAAKSVLKEFVGKYGGLTKERVRSSVHCLQAYLVMLTFAIGTTLSRKNQHEPTKLTRHASRIRPRACCRSCSWGGIHL